MTDCSFREVKYHSRGEVLRILTHEFEDISSDKCFVETGLYSKTQTKD